MGTLDGKGLGEFVVVDSGVVEDARERKGSARGGRRVVVGVEESREVNRTVRSLLRGRDG